MRGLFTKQFKLAGAMVMAVVFVPLSGTLYFCKCEGRVPITPELPAKAECCVEKQVGDTPESCPKPCYEPVRMMLATPAEFPNLATALDKRGYSSADIVKILGGNWMRLFAEVWQA